MALNGWNWYIIVSLVVMIWSFINAWVFMPAFTILKLRKELKNPKFVEEIQGYILAMILEEKEVTREDGTIQKMSMFSYLLDGAFGFIWDKAQQKLKNYKSQMSKNADKLAEGSDPMMGAMYQILPKKLRGFAPIIFDYMAHREQTKAAAQAEVQSPYKH